MDRFPTAGHLVSWAKFAPGVKESAGKKKGSGSTGMATATWPGCWAQSSAKAATDPPPAARVMATPPR